MFVQVFVGKADVLHVELCKHFDGFGKKREDIREIDDELCHHTDASGWEITVWPLQVLAHNNKHVHMQSCSHAYTARTVVCTQCAVECDAQTIITVYSLIKRNNFKSGFPITGNAKQGFGPLD